MFGLEIILGMGPTGYLFLVMLLLPFIYCLPNTVIVSDLATVFPLDGGVVAWIDLAFGPYVGTHNAIWFDLSRKYYHYVWQLLLY